MQVQNECTFSCLICSPLLREVSCFLAIHSPLKSSASYQLCISLFLELWAKGLCDVGVNRSLRRDNLIGLLWNYNTFVPKHVFAMGKRQFLWNIGLQQKAGIYKLIFICICSGIRKMHSLICHKPAKSVCERR